MEQARLSGSALSVLLAASLASGGGPRLQRQDFAAYREGKLVVSPAPPALYVPFSRPGQYGPPPLETAKGVCIGTPAAQVATLYAGHICLVNSPAFTEQQHQKYKTTADYSAVAEELAALPSLEVTYSLWETGGGAYNSVDFWVRVATHQVTVRDAVDYYELKFLFENGVVKDIEIASVFGCDVLRQL